MWLCEISPQRHAPEEAGNQNTNLSKNLENADKRAAKRAQKLLEVGRFRAAETLERVGRSKRLQNISHTFYARAQMHGKISTDGLMPLQKSTNGGSNSHRYKKVPLWSGWSSSLPPRKFALEWGYRTSE